MCRSPKNVEFPIQLDHESGAAWDYITETTLKILVIDRVMKLMVPELASLQRAGHRLTVDLTAAWNSETIEPVFGKWLHRLEHEASEDNNDFPSVVGSVDVDEV